MKFNYKQYKNSPWVSGEYGIYSFEAKVFDNPSHYGIGSGRVCELYIDTDQDELGRGGEMINYDGCWYRGSDLYSLYTPLVNELDEIPLHKKRGWFF